MQGHTRKLPTSGRRQARTCRVLIESPRGQRRELFVSPSVSKELLRLAKQLEVDRESIPAEEVFKDLDAKYTRPGAVLRGARGKENLTQAQLADKLGIRQSDVSAMEWGRRPIGKAMAKRLAKVLNIGYRVFL